MTLTTHAVVGAGIVSVAVYNPVLGLTLAFASHFLLDAIPHWSYEIKSASVKPHGGVSHISFDKDFFADICWIGTDGLLGIALSILFFSTPATLYLVLAGASLAMLPDALQFVYSKWKHEPLVSLQKFHEWIHTRYRFEKHPAWGVVSQILFIAVFVVLLKI